MNWTDQILAVAFVFLLLGAAIFVLGRLSGGFHLLDRFRRPHGPQALRCTARLPLTAQHSIHIVELQGRTVVVATFPGGVAFEPPSSAFSSVLGEAIQSRETKQ